MYQSTVFSNSFSSFMLSHYLIFRCPRNSVALDLIRASKVPIAAPSANRFGHISPSCSSHVIKNFETIRLHQFPSQRRLPVLEGGPCSIGIESTVCKVERKDSSLKITVLRRGYVTREMLYQAIAEGVHDKKEGVDNLSVEELEMLRKAEVEVSEKIVYIQDSNGLTSESRPQTIPSTVSMQHYPNTSMCSPGMLLSHYSPSVPTFLCPAFTRSISARSLLRLPDVGGSVQLGECVVIDAFGALAVSKEHAVGYFPLSNCYDVTATTVETMLQTVFQQLHNAEDLALKENAKLILVYDFQVEAVQIGEAALAVYDRLYRYVLLVGWVL